MCEIDQNKVYFKCITCEYVFQEDPMIVVRCPMCGSEDVVRV
ncbi:MAG: hypothetical protein SBU_000596 [Candidatus Syntrophoarchaeum butanivorans]|uniref:Hydrogenase maturation nickel metallochaperone HypA n=1 Tax=Candidatus Syntropharchaeum butanivorans TaxID=1839936 RepID=A0A1F2P5P4_9EURY|nr:MAG: hypothetical protein SBU_000596 [Candidatus Syntrophoarchaeum butanivorans]